MFIAALFIIAKTWKKPKCLSVGKWIKCGTSRQWNINQRFFKKLFIIQSFEMSYEKPGKGVEET